MQLKPHPYHHCRFGVRLGILVFLMGLFVTPGFATELDSRVVVKAGARQVHADQLKQKLRLITGWIDLSFDDEGRLRLGSRETLKGSKGARELLKKAVAGTNLILIEDANNRLDVVFCRVDEVRWINAGRSHPPLYLILIDFADFEEVIGDKEARAAFDVGWGLLHELHHVVEDSHDASSALAPGECEVQINKMRRELGLPERKDYFFTSLPVRSDLDHVTRFVSLRFEQRETSKRVRRYSLIWDAAVVGGLPSESESSMLRAWSALR